VSRVSRADWAAQVPASGIVGVVPAKNIPTVPPGSTDIGSLKASGFTPGSVPLWNGSKFVPVPLPVIPTTPGLTLTSQYPFINWTLGSLRPLESTEEPIVVPGATMSSLLFVAPLPGFDYLWFRARVTSVGQATVEVTNMSGDVVALTDQTYQVFVLT